MIVSQIFKREICKEVLQKSGFDNDKKAFDSVVAAVMNDRFLFQLDNNEVIVFVSWEKPQIVDVKRKVFVNNFWIDPRYRNGRYSFKIRTTLRNMFKDTKGIWFNRKKQKLVERI